MLHLTARAAVIYFITKPWLELNFHLRIATYFKSRSASERRYW